MARYSRVRPYSALASDAGGLPPPIRSGVSCAAGAVMRRARAASGLEIGCYGAGEA